MKNKIIEKVGILLFVVPVIFGQLGCNKFLDRKPLGQGITGDVSQGGVESDVFGLYAATRNWGMTSLPFLTEHAARADDNLISTPGDGDENAIDHFNYSKDFWLSTPLRCTGRPTTKRPMRSSLARRLK